MMSGRNRKGPLFEPKEPAELRVAFALESPRAGPEAGLRARVDRDPEFPLEGPDQFHRAERRAALHRSLTPAVSFPILPIRATTFPS